MDLWSNHQQYSPPLLKHQYNASSRSTWTHLHATSEPSTDAALDIGTSRKPTHTTAASSNASDWMAQHPTTHSTTATGLADQQNSSSPWSSISDQIWTGNTPVTKVQGLCSLLGGECRDKSRPLFANSIFFFFVVLFCLFICFGFFFWRRGDVTLCHVTALVLLAIDCSKIQHSWMNLFGGVCNKNIQHECCLSFDLRIT